VPGAILAAVLLEIVKWGIGAYLGSFQSYQKLYGTVAFVPILLLWIYLCWVAVLLGASLASSMAAFRYQPAEMRLPQGYEFYALLRLLGRFQQARSHGRGLADDDILQHEPMMTDSLLHQLLCDMERIELVTRAENGNWMLARDLDQLTLSDLYESTQLRIPVSEQLLPYRQDSLGKAAMAALDELRLPLREKLKRRVSDIYPPGETR
jgi:membrane protein